mgnify:CR=1 FL=1
MTEKHTFDCTPREARRIAENLRYTAAARELYEASYETLRVIDALREVNVLGEWPVVREALQTLRTTTAQFRITADE